MIIPVYNAQTTLRQSIDSVLSQTYTDLEVLLIDDGSTDHSGEMMDSYRAKDSRVTVLRKENGGLSSARNYGLSKATGTFVSFVDADDWVEKNTFETALRHIGEADICVFGRSEDYPQKRNVWIPSEKVEEISREEALEKLLLGGSIGQAAWNKIYRRSLFDTIRFPEGYNYEDARIMYKLFQQARSVAVIPDVFYHYMQYKGSIAHVESAKNRLDHWTAYYELYKVFHDRGEEYQKACIRRCANSMIKAWGSLWKSNQQEREQEKDRIGEIVSFGKRHRKEFDNRAARVGAALVSTGTRWSMFIAYLMRGFYNAFHRQRLYAKE